MPGLFDAPEQRFADIITGARAGASGRAALLTIPVGDFRRAALYGMLVDLGPRAFDRAVEFAWRTSADAPEYLTDNEYDGTGFRIVRLDLRVGYLYGPLGAEHIKTVSGQLAPAALANIPTRRAHNDADRIRRACCLGDLYQGGTDPDISEVRPDGETSLEDLQDGRLVATIPLRMRLALDHGTSYR